MNDRMIDINAENEALNECFLPDHPSVEALHQEIHALLDGVRHAGKTVESILSPQDRVAVIQIADVNDDEFFEEPFACKIFPLIIEFSTLDYLGRSAHDAIENALDEPLARTLNTSHFGVYAMRFDGRFLIARDMVTHVERPLHASAMNIPLRDGDTMIGRIFQTENTNVVIAPFVIPKSAATRLVKTIKVRLANEPYIPFMKTRGAPIVMRAAMAVLRKSIAIDRTLDDINPEQLCAVHDAWFEIVDSVKGHRLTLDGMCPDGSLFHLVSSPNARPSLYRFLDIRGRANVLIGGTERNTAGWLKLGCVDAKRVKYGTSILQHRHVTSFCKVGRDGEAAAMTNLDMEGWRTTLYWVQQSLKNRSHDLAA